MLTQRSRRPGKSCLVPAGSTWYTPPNDTHSNFRMSPTTAFSNKTYNQSKFEQVAGEEQKQLGLLSNKTHGDIKRVPVVGTLPNSDVV